MRGTVSADGADAVAASALPKLVREGALEQREANGT